MHKFKKKSFSSTNTFVNILSFLNTFLENSLNMQNYFNLLGDFFLEATSCFTSLAFHCGLQSVAQSSHFIWSIKDCTWRVVVCYNSRSKCWVTVTVQLMNPRQVKSSLTCVSFYQTEASHVPLYNDRNQYFFITTQSDEPGALERVSTSLIWVTLTAVMVCSNRKQK